MSAPYNTALIDLGGGRRRGREFLLPYAYGIGNHLLGQPTHSYGDSSLPPESWFVSIAKVGGHVVDKGKVILDV